MTLNGNTRGETRPVARLKGYANSITFAVASLVALIVVSVFGYLLIQQLAANAIERNAERLSMSWGNYLGGHIPNLEQLLSGTKITPRQEREIVGLKKYSGVFRFKLFASDGTLVFVSDDAQSDLKKIALAEHNPTAARVIAQQQPLTVVADGTQKANRPEIYAESYIPIIRDGQTIGIVEAYVDQTEDAAAITDSFLEFQLVFGLMMLMAASVPFSALGIVLKKLRTKNAELEIARDEALGAEKTKSEFLATMSHEIRTPMNGVMGTAELLAGTTLDARQTMFIDIIQTSSKALLDIINDILDFSKIDANQITLSNKPFKLSQLAGDPVSLVAHNAAEKNIELTVRVAPDAPRFVIGDPDRLRQVVVNLLGNAVKFTERGDVNIDISVVEEDEKLTLKVEVRDTGVGIPAEELPNIFDRFSQVDSSSTRTYQGTGLGLAISKGLIEKMGGEIGVKSNPGAGSTFFYSVPVQSHEDDETDKPRHVELRGRRVLVVDDNPTNRFIFQEQLTSWGFDTSVTSSGRDGIQAATSAALVAKPFDLILLDHHMPGMDGEDVLRTLRQSAECANTPVIILTSILENASLERCQNELSLDGWMTKPAGSSALLDKIATVVSESSQRQSGIDKLRPMTSQAEHAPAESTRTATASNPAAERQADQSVQVLVIEDNSVNQILVEHILQSLGLTFTCVEDGQEGIKAFKQHRPSMIIMDVSMPVMNGYEATQAIRTIESQENWLRTPVIGTTAHAMSGDKQKCIDAGMDDYISKPLSVEGLSTIVTKWMATSETRQPRAAAE